MTTEIVVALIVSLFINLYVGPRIIQHYRNKWRTELDMQIVDRTRAIEMGNGQRLGN